MVAVNVIRGAIGKSKAMEMCLTGRTIDATEAERCGLVFRVVPLASLFDEPIRIASVIASMSLPTTRMIKATVNRAFETPLAEGIQV